MEFSNKRIGLIVAAILAAYMLIGSVAAFAKGSAEANNTPTRVTLLHEGDTQTPGAEYPTSYARAAGIVQKRYPGTTVEIIQGVVQGVVDVTLETMCASGQAPNVIALTVMRSSKFFRDGQGINLKEYIPEELKKYESSMLSRVTRNGKVYAVPSINSPLGLNINVTLAEEAGFKMPAPGSNWTMEQFMDFCAKIKAKGKYGAVFFAGSNPIPYVTCWWTSFGVKFFENADYSKVAINGPQIRAALAWMKDMQNKGYVAPNASQIVDDDMVALWAEGKVGACAIFPGFLLEVDAKVKAGVLKEPFKTQWMPFPLASGVAKTETFFNYAAIVAMDKKDKRVNKISADLAYLCADEGFQRPVIEVGSGISSLIGVANTNKAWHMQDLADIVNRDGAYDMGSETAKYPAFRPIVMPYLAKFFDGKIDAEQFIKEYEKAANEALK
jgi:ABC-type glycerol-3-phosphate transport system substrate-binding protein